MWMAGAEIDACESYTPAGPPWHVWPALCLLPGRLVFHFKEPGIPGAGGQQGTTVRLALLATSWLGSGTDPFILYASLRGLFSLISHTRKTSRIQ